jgi:hypothetical protein
MVMACQIHTKDLTWISIHISGGQTFDDGIRGQLLDKTPLLVCIQVEMESIN